MPASAACAWWWARAGEQDIMTLRAEAAGTTPASRRSSPRRCRRVTKLKGEVEIVAPGSLPNDGKVIADERTYT